jgi:hypothetical protein
LEWYFAKRAFWPTTSQSEYCELAMHTTCCLQKAARAPAARQEAQRLLEKADAALAEAEDLRLQARLEDLNV